MPNNIVFLAEKHTDPIAAADFVDAPEMMDGMIAAQGRFGQVTWTDLSETIAMGTSFLGGRVAVIDLDQSGAAGLRAALWVTHGDK